MEKPIRCKWQENCTEKFIKVLEKKVESLHNVKDKNHTEDNLKSNSNTNSYNVSKTNTHYLIYTRRYKYCLHKICQKILSIR